jgi:cellulose synthase/poly-beta-1,6-N-acetylglucosamine synthase-like glycosyltransferase
LVMHGMLTAFRARALRHVGPFLEQHLIEDYEMTTRIKARGFDVKVVLDALSWTEVPETLRDFWRQRTRWSLGGVQVVLGAGDKSVVIQDVLGHGVFIATLAVIVLVLLMPGGSVLPNWVTFAIISISCAQLISWYGLQVWLMRWYKERDIWDWLLRLALIPELLYSNIMTVVLLGSYAYIAFTRLAKYLVRLGAVGKRLASLGYEAFRWIGYSGQWGTRS